MRKLIIIGMAVVMLAIPSIASADVPRCAAPVTESVAATFQVTSPSGAGGLWTTNYSVTVKPDGSFIGSGITSGLDNGDMKTIEENVTGTFTDNNADGKADVVSFTSVRPQPLYTATWMVKDAPLNGTPTQGSADGINWDLWFTVTGEPQMAAATTTDLNHGEYVSSMGGGKIAAQKCQGMPLVSKQGVK
jgi:hypothetical protein